MTDKRVECASRGGIALPRISLRNRLLLAGLLVLVFFFLESRVRRFLKERKHRRRLKRFREIASAHPGTIEAAGARYTMGLIYQNNLGDYSKAIDEYQMVLEINTDLADSALYNMGCCHEALGDEVRARKTFAEVLKRFPTSSRVEDAQYKIDELALRN